MPVGKLKKKKEVICADFHFATVEIELSRTNLWGFSLVVRARIQWQGEIKNHHIEIFRLKEM